MAKASRTERGFPMETPAPPTLDLVVHHIAIICSDYVRSKAFYGDVLMFPLIRETYREARQSWKGDFQVGAVQIELFSFPASPLRPSYPEAQGLRHLAFGAAAFDAVCERLSGAGVILEPVRLDEATGRRFTFFADPDGLPLELYETPPDNGSAATVGALLKLRPQ